MLFSPKSLVRAAGAVPSSLNQLPTAFEALESRQMLAADLQINIGLLDPSGQVQPGTIINVPLALNNAGDASPTDTVALRLFASADATLDISDTIVFARVLDATEVPTPGQTISSTPVFTLPSLSLGTYFIIGLVVTQDSGGAVLAQDNDVSDNSLILAADQQADLQIDIGLLDPSGQVQPGATINVPVALTNAGSGSSTDTVALRFFASADATLDSADTIVFARVLDATEVPAPGQTINSTPALTLPSLPLGTYFIIGSVVTQDAGGSVLAQDNDVSDNSLILAADQQADLQIDIGLLDPSGQVQPGATINVPVALTNAGSGSSTDTVALRFFASADATLDSADTIVFARVLDATEVPTPGQTINSTPAFALPSLPLGTYFIIGSVVTQDSGGSVLAQDDDVSDNSLVIGNDHTIQTFSPGSPASYIEADGTTVRVSLEGRGATGSGQVIDFGNGIIDITVTGSNHRTTLAFKTRLGEADIRNITVDGSLKKIDARFVNFDGDVSITGSLSEARFNNASGDSTFTIGSGGKDVRLAFGDVEDLSITSAAPIAELRARNWADTNSTVDLISAPSIKRIFTKNDFGASLALSGEGARKKVLDNVDIKGQVTGGTWVIQGNVGDIASWGILDAWSASISGDVKSLRVHGQTAGTITARSFDKIDLKGSVDSLLVLAGASLGDDGLLGGVDVDADTFGGGTIKSIHIRGPVTSSTFGAGIDPVDGILFNGNDDFVTGASRIGKLNIRGQVTDSFFLARNLTGDVNSPGGNDDHGRDDKGGNGNQGGGSDNDNQGRTRKTAHGHGMMARLLRRL